MKYNDLRYQVTGGVVLIFLGIALLSSNYVVEKREEVFSSMNLELSENILASNSEMEEENNEREESADTDISEEVKQVEKQPINVDYQSYAGILEINKIGFYKGFYAKDSSLNDVKINIKILDVSNYPDEKNGNFIIIGHSGNYSNSYFANLYQLQLGDIASVYYKEHKYNYKIVDVYYEEKDGSITIYRDKSKSTMTLITCTKDDDTKQTVYILELDSVE